MRVTSIRRHLSGLAREFAPVAVAAALLIAEAQRAFAGGGNSGKSGGPSVPEIGLGGTAAAVTLLIGGGLLLRDRSRRNRPD